jgi:hypothetical protein
VNDFLPPPTALEAIQHSMWVFPEIVDNISIAILSFG